MIQLSKNKQFLLALIIPVIILLGMTVKPLLTTFFGETIYLQTVLFDPRDLFYGDYVDLQFEIERLPVTLLDKELQSKLESNGHSFKDYKDTSVYIVLELNQQSGIHEAVIITEKKPSSSPYIKGIMSPYLSYSDWDDQNSQKVVYIDIPVERYFLEENTGKQLEQDAREGRLIAEIKVKNGYPILQGILKDARN
ncbi:GDYXXLXY domain-containing protein [Bacillus sp. JJ1474]|uniref:GDYXXLXY domain-containing protein n=1 Tax=Bacillus sp. JJ1474 TaxID=3122955 RepID=UPI002FFDA331